MSYRSLESMIRNVLTEGLIDEASLGDSRGLMALARRKRGDEKDVMMRTADMMKKGQIKDLNMFMKAMDKSTHDAIMPFFDKKHHKALHEDIEEIEEKTLTPAELKKREEVAKALERENPKMPMPQKMAIATATAKKVAEEEITEGPGYKASSEKAVKGGYRAHLKNPQGKTSYTGSVAYKTAKHAKGEAEAYHKAYFHTPGMKTNDRGADRAIHDYRKKNSQHIHEAYVEIYLDEARGYGEADTHIIMQLRSAQDLDGKKDIQFRGGKKAKVDKKHIDKILKIHDHPALKPVQKRKIRVAISKSPKHLADFANKLKMEDYSLEEAMKIDKAKLHRVLNPTKNLNQGIAAVKKAFNVSDAEASKMIMQLINENLQEKFANPAQQAAAMAAIKAKPGYYKKPKKEGMDETKGAPKGYHFTRDGKLRKGDAGQDGHGGPMLRSDPLDKQRKKIPPLPEDKANEDCWDGYRQDGMKKKGDRMVPNCVPEEMDDDGKEVIHTRKADYKLTKVRQPDGRMAYRKVKREIDIEK